LAHLPQASPHDDPPQQSPVAAQPPIANAHDATAIRQNRLTVDIHLLMTQISITDSGPAQHEHLIG
jgi:hypothetical protein